jgi:GNAT superfamily N-acetyltransferase
MHVTYRLNPPLSNAQLDQLYVVSWPNHHPPYDWQPELGYLLCHVGAFVGDELVGFVKLAWDGFVHAWVLEPTVRPDLRRRGIGRELVARAVDVARERGLEWVHVDFAPELRPFYLDACGFSATDAGLIRLK